MKFFICLKSQRNITVVSAEWLILSVACNCLADLSQNERRSLRRRSVVEKLSYSCIWHTNNGSWVRFGLQTRAKKMPKNWNECTDASFMLTSACFQCRDWPDKSHVVVMHRVSQSCCTCACKWWASVSAVDAHILPVLAARTSDYLTALVILAAAPIVKASVLPSPALPISPTFPA